MVHCCPKASIIPYFEGLNARVRKPSQPFDQAFVMAPIDVINRFKVFCNETGVSYGEALDELMRRAKISITD
ncbi:hypothetical protein CWR43_14475 [Rhizobium sullae]|uniref:Uncharacterized protein n=1 Tax=Rhizobium sullae TaxID=50338 RepID=A0A2N0DAW7_RHISU|nr:hypothetical protein CWR43_14475 [Rhizobium sullae]